MAGFKVVGSQLLKNAGSACISFASDTTVPTPDLLGTYPCNDVSLNNKFELIIMRGCMCTKGSVTKQYTRELLSKSRFLMAISSTSSIISASLCRWLAWDSHNSLNWQARHFHLPNWFELSNCRRWQLYQKLYSIYLYKHYHWLHVPFILHYSSPRIHPCPYIQANVLFRQCNSSQSLTVPSKLQAYVLLLLLILLCLVEPPVVYQLASVIHLCDLTSASQRPFHHYRNCIKFDADY